jgi:hypothetical protein
MTLPQLLTSTNPAAALKEALDQHKQTFNHNIITAFDYPEQAHIMIRRSQIAKLIFTLGQQSVDEQKTLLEENKTLVEMFLKEAFEVVV